MPEQINNAKIDTLNRAGDIKKIQDVINVLKMNGKGGSFAISAGWGYGKTFVLEKLVDALSKDDYVIIHYNCWKYDYYEEPLVALLSSAVDQLKNDNELEKVAPVVNKAIKYMLLKSCLAIGRTLSKAHFGVDFVKAGEETYNFIKDELKDFGLPEYNTNSSLQESLDIMQGVLKKIAAKKQLIIIIDELDRCLPAYQIKILERMHHLMDGQANIAIYAINPEQLHKTIEQMYGGDSEERTAAYLKKFIDFQVMLSIGSMKDNIYERYCENLADFEEIPDGEEFDEFCDIIPAMFSECDARTVNKIWAKQSLIHRLVYSDNNDSGKPSYKILCAELMILVILQWQKKVCGVGSIIIPTKGTPVSSDVLLYSARFTPPNNIKKSIKNIHGFWQLWENIARSLSFDQVNDNKHKECIIVQLPDDRLSIMQSIGIFWCNASKNKYLQYSMSEKNISGTVSNYYNDPFEDNCHAIEEFYKLACIIE